MFGEMFLAALFVLWFASVFLLSQGLFDLAAWIVTRLTETDDFDRGYCD